MTATERVLAAICFETPDRIPIWDNFRAVFTRNWRAWKGVGEDVNPADHYGIDMTTRVADETFFPSRRRLVGRKGGDELWDDGWGRIVRRKLGDGAYVMPVEPYLADPARLETLVFDPPDLDSRYAGFAEGVAAERAKGRCVFAKVGGIYIRTQFVRGEERLLMDMAGDPGFCDALLDRTAAHLIAMALETLRRGNLWETGLLVYDDMAGTKAPTFSPRMFERYLLPRYRRLIDSVRAAGCRHVFLHSDGNIAPHIDLLLDAGFEGFHPMEPRCGLDLVALRERLGRRAVFFGGMCNTRVLPSGDRREIEAFVRPLLELGRHGGLIFGQSSVSEDIAPEAYDFYHGLVRGQLA